MQVYKRDPRVDAQYYVSGNTVRRNVRNLAQAEPATRRVPNNRAEYFQTQERTRRVESGARRNSMQTQRVQQRTQRRAEPVADTRTRQERRRAEPARAYYSAQPETQRLTRAEVNHRTVQMHAWQRAQEERRRREEEARIQAEVAQEQYRRRQMRVHALFAVMAIAAVVCVALGVYTLLNRYIAIEQMTVEQRRIQAEIDDQAKRLEELQVDINTQSNIAQVQDYAHDSLNMDYAQKENTRVIALPGQD